MEIFDNIHFLKIDGQTALQDGNYSPWDGLKRNQILSVGGVREKKTEILMNKLVFLPFFFVPCLLSNQLTLECERLN